MSIIWKTFEPAKARNSEYLSLAGMKLDAILSAELFTELLSVQDGRLSSSRMDAACHDRWTDLADTLASSPVEGFSVLTNSVESGTSFETSFVFLAVGRGPKKEAARGECLKGVDLLWKVLTTTLDYAQLVPLEASELQRTADCLDATCNIEIRRKIDSVNICDGELQRRPIGFSESDQTGTPSDDNRGEIRQLFPWVPSNDPWRRLVEMVATEETPCSMLVHFQTYGTTPQACIEEARAILLNAERLVSLSLDPIARSLLTYQTDSLRPEAFRRLAIAQSRCVGARVFVSSGRPVNDAVLSIVQSSIDDASIDGWQPGYETLFKGGAVLGAVTSSDVVAPLSEPNLEILFGAREASAILRTPMPSAQELPGIKILRSRTLSMTGTSGEDCPIGFNKHRGTRVPVQLDNDLRFRHTYVIGQTGTGKSTFLLNSILHDIEAGRGVAVLDPHGSLMADILLRFPAERADDLVIIDVTDQERPVPFNPLYIKESDWRKYRISRDLLIDDLMSFFESAYMAEMRGPMFESHVRGFMSLLLGTQPQESPLIPNLLIFRSLYQNSELRKALTDRMQGEDVLIDEFIKEVTSASHDSSLANMSPYVTSKFNRFVSDMSLRNITCQNDCIDLDTIVKEGKVLIFHLGKGRFGDQAAGLLASQVISRIRSAVLKRGTSNENRPFYVYADEFQIFADQRFAELLAEARKFGLSLTLAHQYTGQIPREILESILGNVGTMVVFRIGASDAEMLAPSFSPYLAERDLSSLANFNAYVRSFGRLGQTPFSVECLPPSADVDEERAKALRLLARLKHGRNQEEVEEEIRHTYDAYRNFRSSSVSTDSDDMIEAI